MVLASACALALGSVAAEGEEEGAGASSAPVLEEVVVTAQRRAENLMDVPLAVTALSGEELERLGALNLTYLGQVSPNTTIEPARGTNNALAAYIRGIGQQDHIAGFESGVGLYVDDVYYNRPQAALLDIYEVERIEVLRGPQGTLYGRNTVGGAIKYISRRLDDTAELRLRGRVGNYGLADAIAAGTLPLGDELRVGGTFGAFTLDGFGDNLHIPGVKNYDKDVKAARLSTEWTPDPAWFIRLSGDRLQDDSNLRRGHRLLVGGFSGAPVLDNVFDTRAGNTVPTPDSESSGYSLLTEWQATQALQFRAIIAVREDETWKPVDLDALPTVDVDVSTLDRNEQTSAEFQALFNADRWSAVAGAFFLDASAFTVLDVVLGTIGDFIGKPGISNQLQADVDTRSWAIFTDLNYRFNDRWSASIGGRYTHDRRASQIHREILVGGVSPFFGGTAEVVETPSDFDGTADFERVTPRLAVQWHPSDSGTCYLSYSEGFKGGGFDPRGYTSRAPDFDGDGVVSPAEVQSFMRFDPEEVQSWEAGWKATVLGGRMDSRLAIFRTDYTDMQIPGSVSVDDPDGSIQYYGTTTNAGAADMSGVEWEGRVILAEGLGNPESRLNLAWALGYIDAGFSEFIDENGQDVADLRVIANTPKWTASVTLDYDLPVSWFGSRGDLAFLTTVSWRDDQFQFEQPIPLFDQKAYSLWDMSVTWSDRSGRWQLGLHAQNLTDEQYKVSGLDIDLGRENNFTAYYGNPRQYWLDVQFRLR